MKTTEQAPPPVPATLTEAVRAVGLDMSIFDRNPFGNLHRNDAANRRRVFEHLRACGMRDSAIARLCGMNHATVIEAMRKAATP